MKFGQKIKKLRTEAGLTQKGLAEKMNVSFQTISKWESGLNEPDIANIKELCKIFDCSFEYLLNDDLDEKEEKKIEIVEKKEEPQQVEEKKEEPKEEEKPQNVPAINKDGKKQIATCSRCGQPLFPGDQINIVKTNTPNGETKVVRICEKCYKKFNYDSKETTKIIHAPTSKKKNTIAVQKAKPTLTKEEKEEKNVLTWAIIVAILGLVGTLIACIVRYQDVGLGWTIALPIIVGYVLLADIYCIFSASWIGEVFLDVASWTIRMPGIIFSFSLDGLKFLIMMKLLFALIGFLIGVGALLLAIAISSVLSVFSFPFVLAGNTNK